MYDISPEELKDYKAYTIVDIRDSMSYAYGHLPDAISVPQAELSTYIDEWKDAGKILIYCKRGEASLDAVLMLREQGVEAYNLKTAAIWRGCACHAGTSRSTGYGFCEGCGREHTEAVPEENLVQVHESNQ